MWLFSIAYNVVTHITPFNQPFRMNKNFPIAVLTQREIGPWNYSHCKTADKNVWHARNRTRAGTLIVQAFSPTQTAR